MGFVWVFCFLLAHVVYLCEFFVVFWNVARLWSVPLSLDELSSVDVFELGQQEQGGDGWMEALEA